MHFTTAVPDGRTLVMGVGTEIANNMIALLPGLETGDVRDAIKATTICDLETSACDGVWEFPDFPEGTTIEQWRQNFFSLPNINVASNPPFTKFGRDFAAVLENITALSPSVN